MSGNPAIERAPRVELLSRVRVRVHTPHTCIRLYDRTKHGITGFSGWIIADRNLFQLLASFTL